MDGSDYGIVRPYVRRSLWEFEKKVEQILEELGLSTYIQIFELSISEAIQLSFCDDHGHVYIMRASVKDDLEKVERSICRWVLDFDL